MLANGLLYYAIFPLVVSTTCLVSKPIVGINVALFLLRQVYSYVKYRPVVEAVTQMIFLPYQPAKALAFVQEYPADVRYYSFSWIPPSQTQATSLTECKAVS